MLSGVVHRYEKVGSGALDAQPPVLQALVRLTIDTFILSGYPHLEEAYRTAELLFPRLPLNLPATQQQVMFSPLDAQKTRTIVD